MLLTLSRAFLALTLSALLVFLVGAPLLVRHFGGPFVDAYLAPLALKRLDGELSFNPLKLQLTIDDLELGHHGPSPGASQPPVKVGQVEQLTLDFFDRSLTIDNGWLTMDSAATALGIDPTKASGLRAEGWLQPLNRLFLAAAKSDEYWPSELELPRLIFQATVQQVVLNDVEARLSDTGSVFNIFSLTGSVLADDRQDVEAGGVSDTPPLHNWDVDARINKQPFQLSVRPQRTPGGAIFYLELKDLQFAAADFSTTGLALPPLPGLRDVTLLEGQIGMQGELVVEFEAEKRALTAIELQLGFSGLRGQGQYTDASGASRTLDLRTEQFSADINQLQWLAEDQLWTPERIRLQASSELVLTSFRFRPTSAPAESFISTKAAAAELLIDWQKGTLLEVHSEQLTIQSLKAHLDDRLLTLAEGALELCGLPPGLAPDRERISISTSIEMSALTAFQDNCWFRQLILDGTELAIADDEAANRLEPLRVLEHRLVVTDFSTQSSAEPTAIEFTGTMPGSQPETQTPVNLVVNLLDSAPELIRFSMTDYQSPQLALIGDWLQRLAGLQQASVTADSGGRVTDSKALMLEIGRLGDQYSGFAQIRKPPEGTVQASRALSFTVTPYGALSEELWTPLLETLRELNDQP
ncbi:hypothetical protein [Allohahella marinimesophila]|uniref:AsmA protein n=1 Tax=Allohahella marinimesophila TaxID=1054972 RepID=A0ABP7Q0A0_9GAMM